MIIKFKKLKEEAQIPQYATSSASGMDIAACLDSDIIIPPMNIAVISTGLACELPMYFEAQVRSRSGLAAKNSVCVFNSPGTIDNDYRGEIKIILANFGKENFTVKHGMRIAQIVICEVRQCIPMVVEELGHGLRGDKGFGSTGV